MTARFNFMHFMPMCICPRNHKGLPVAVGRLSQQILRSHKAAAFTTAISTSSNMPTGRLRRDRRERASQHQLFDDARAESHRRGAHLARKNGANLRRGTPPNLEYPNRLAEEYAMLDVMSRGRLEVAFPLGTGMEIGLIGQSATARELTRNRSRSS